MLLDYVNLFPFIFIFQYFSFYLQSQWDGLNNKPSFGFFKIRFLIASIVSLVYSGHPYHTTENTQTDYVLMEDFDLRDWEFLYDMIIQTKILCCRNDCRELKATTNSLNESKASWSTTAYFAGDFEHCLELIDLQKVVAPLRSILNSNRPSEEMAEAISQHL